MLKDAFFFRFIEMRGNTALITKMSLMFFLNNFSKKKSGHSIFTRISIWDNISAPSTPLCPVFVTFRLPFKLFRRGSRILKWGVNFCNNVIEPKPGGGDKKKRKKEGGSEKKGVKIHPFHLPLICACCCLAHKMSNPYFCLDKLPTLHIGLVIYQEKNLLVVVVWRVNQNCQAANL